MLEDLAVGTAPGVLLLDWHMPEMSGSDVCRFVRERLDLAKLPILILTASGTSADLLEALATGANDFVRKPVPEPELVARVSALMSMAQLHAKLMEAERKLRVEADFRERFIGMLAHDLRQPLNTIFMAHQSLAQAEITLDWKGSVLGMHLRAASRMKRMISDLLDFTRNRPETGMPIQRQECDFADILRGVLEELGPRQPERVLTAHLAGSCIGHWDPDRLAQICSNLIGNAFEHGSPATPVAIQLVGGVGEVELRVSNQGEAISPLVQATLFQPFGRGGTGRRPTKGLGLGLYIVQQIVLAHGGLITLERLQEETHFVVRLPRRAPCSDSG